MFDELQNNIIKFLCGITYHFSIDEIIWNVSLLGLIYKLQLSCYSVIKFFEINYYM